MLLASDRFVPDPVLCLRWTNFREREFLSTHGSNRLGLAREVERLLLDPFSENAAEKSDHTTGQLHVHILFQNGAAEIIAASTSMKALSRS